MLLAGKDASSYLLKDKTSHTSLAVRRIQRWHRDGVFLYILYILPILSLHLELYWIINIFICAILIRLSVFDLAFNYWAELNIRYLGSTSYIDKIFSRILGNNGALYKSLFFILVLIAWNVLVKL